MSRTVREAKLKAIWGDKYGDVLVTELGGRKRDRKKMLQDLMLKSYARGTISKPAAPATPSWHGLTTQGAPAPLQRLMNPDQKAFQNAPGLRNLSSSGSLGHMFKGSSAGPGGNPFSVGGGSVQMPAQPAPAPIQPRSGPDFHGLRTPGMGEMRQSAVTVPQVYAPTMPTSGPQYNDSGSRRGSTAWWWDKTPLGGYGGAPLTQESYSNEEMDAFDRWAGGQSWEKGTLPSYQLGTMASAPPGIMYDPAADQLQKQQQMQKQQMLARPQLQPAMYGPQGRRINQHKLRMQGLTPGSAGWNAAGQPRPAPAPLPPTVPTAFRLGTLPSYAGGSITARLPEGVSYTEALDELLMGPSMDEAQDPAYRHLLAKGPDKALHAAFFGRLARGLGGGSTGAALADTAGFTREALQGAGSLLRGRGFTGPQGFDPEDINANWQGIDLTTGRR